MQFIRTLAKGGRVPFYVGENAFVKPFYLPDMRAWDKWVPLLRAAESLIPPPLVTRHEWPKCYGSQGRV
jgi:hypothetical protein